MTPAAIESYRKILVLSPHLDDGVLSVGGTIAKATALGAEVVVATVFTGDAPLSVVLSPIARELHAWWKLGPNPYEVRRLEDMAAVHHLGGRILHGGLLDCVYRTSHEGNPLYASRASVFSKPARLDDIYESLAALYRHWMDTVQPDLVLCPLGVGQHVDHVIVTEAFRRVALDGAANVALYEDIPYATGIFPVGAPDTVEAALARSAWLVNGFQFVTVDVPVKMKAIAEYASQLPEIFRDGLDFTAVLGEYMRFGEDSGPARERVWLPQT